MKTIKDTDIKNKTVLIRCDLNVPIKDGKIEDDNRIVKSLKTINYASFIQAEPCEITEAYVQKEPEYVYNSVYSV